MTLFHLKKNLYSIIFFEKQRKSLKWFLLFVSAFLFYDPSDEVKRKKGKIKKNVLLSLSLPIVLFEKAIIHMHT